MAKVLEDYLILSKTSDLIKREYECEQIDFLKYKGTWDGDIMTNPPFKHAEEFVKKSLKIIPDGKYVIMFLRLPFLETIKRKKIFVNNNFHSCHILTKRETTYKNGDINSPSGTGIAFAWFVWKKGYFGKPILEWI